MVKKPPDCKATDERARETTHESAAVRRASSLSPLRATKLASAPSVQGLEEGV